MIAYASRTGTRRNLLALRQADWRLMVSATGQLRNEGFPYALDNGAWTAYQKGTVFDSKAFELALRSFGPDSDFVVVPDIVAGGLRSLEFSLSWLPRVGASCSLSLLAVQDGMNPRDVADLLSPTVGIFIGGTTQWKLATLREWAELARARSCWCHVGRVNTVRRIGLCVEAGAHSFDGTSASRFRKSLAKLDNARRQGDFCLRPALVPRN